jgi:hypothetical protein
MTHVPVRFTVEVGAHSTVEELVAAVEKALDKRLVNPWVRGLLPQVTVSDRKALKIVTPTIKQLYFTSMWTSLQDIHARGIALGYELVPPDLSLSLLLQRPGLRMNEAVYMAMLPLLGSDGKQYLFYVKRERDGVRVCVYRGTPDIKFLLYDQFAFVDPSM